MLSSWRGCAGLTAAIYAQRAGLSTILLEENFYGGQIAISNEIENYPAIPSITGPELAQQIYAQAESLGAQIHFETVTQAELSANPKVVTTHTERYEAKAVIIANGVKRRKLGCPGEEAFTGRGVSYCATCDARFSGEKTSPSSAAATRRWRMRCILPTSAALSIWCTGATHSGVKRRWPTASGRRKTSKFNMTAPCLKSAGKAPSPPCCWKTPKQAHSRSYRSAPSLSPLADSGKRDFLPPTPARR